MSKHRRKSVSIGVDGAMELTTIGNTLKNDITAIHSYIESLAAWVNGYFESKLSTANSHIPNVPLLDSLVGLASSCELMRNCLIKTREKSYYKRQELEYSLEEVTKEKELREKQLAQCKEQLARRQVRLEHKETLQCFMENELNKQEKEFLKEKQGLSQIKAEVESAKREIDNLSTDIAVSCSGLNYALEEAERWGYVRAKTNIEDIKDYVTEIKQVVIILCKEKSQNKYVDKIKSLSRRIESLATIIYQQSSKNSNKTLYNR